MSATEPPNYGDWRDRQAMDQPVCSCGRDMLTRVRIHEEDDDAVSLWSEEHGWMEVLLRYCTRCDPHVVDIYGTKTT